jgi:cellulose synthase/poly-beta-1,6-N-acetylglucosamine synthase-like glycosyltransferase
VSPALFWVTIGIFLTPWVIYPFLLLILSVFLRRYPPSWNAAEDSPSVSVLIAARNEEAVIASRIRNLLEQKYDGSIEILVGSDCSDDSTDSIVGSFSNRGVILYRSPERIGKPMMIRELLSISSGNIIVFSDADTVFSPLTVRELVSPFSDPSVGCVDGSRRNSLDQDTCESIYWKYETAIKRFCSGIGAVLGATGAVFALRRSLYKPLSPRRADDFELAVMARIQGYSCVFNSNAVATEPSPSDAEQYRRLVRIVSWMFVSGLLLMFSALKAKKVFLFLQILVHKVIRWLSGILFFAATLFAGFLSAAEPYRSIFILMVIFHATAAAGWLLKKHIPSKLLFPYYFWLMSIASIDGILRLLTGNPVETWERKTKGPEN